MYRRAALLPCNGARFARQFNCIKLPLAGDFICYNRPTGTRTDAGFCMLQVGQPAPGFELPDADMELVSLAAFRAHRNVVVFFYPRDDTPSCTLESIDFSDLYDDFERHQTVVLGISMDDFLSHIEFRDKYGLAVQLLSDVEGEVCGLYGVLQEVEKDGVRRNCIQRSTFVIDKHGMIAQAWYNVKPRGHAAEVLQTIRSLAKCK